MTLALVHPLTAFASALLFTIRESRYDSDACESKREDILQDWSMHIPTTKMSSRLTNSEYCRTMRASAGGYCCTNRRTDSVQTKPRHDSASIPAPVDNGAVPTSTAPGSAERPALGTPAMLMSPKLRCYLVGGGRGCASEGLAAVCRLDGWGRRRGAGRHARPSGVPRRRPPIVPDRPSSTVIRQ